MPQLVKITRGLSSPAILMAVVWCATLIGVAFGPIDFPRQPSVAVLVLVAVGVSLFVVGDRAGAWCFRAWSRLRPSPPAPPVGTLNIAVIAMSLLGLAGIASIAFDRIVLSGIGNSGYAELLRCAPTLIDVIEIRRTPLLYAGYLTFSFGFVSLVLFVLKGEEVRGWAAFLAQLSILCPIGYALLYSGRMPILFAIVLAIAAVLVRVGQGRRHLPQGHHLLIKTVALLVLFGIYTNAMWASRRNFCTEMSGLAQELLSKGREQEAERFRALKMKRAALEQKLAAERQSAAPEQNPAPDNNPAGSSNSPARDAEYRGQIREVEQQLVDVQQELAQPRQPQSTDAISATDLSKMIDATRASPGHAELRYSPDVSALLQLLGLKREAWHTSPRGYVLSAVESGWLSVSTASNLLNTYFYITHGVYVLDLAWQARAQFTLHWGIYEIGVLSPILRSFLPQNQQLLSMNTELKAAKIDGLFPTAWAAAYIDFGAAGAVIYVLIWGFAAGWSAFGARHSSLATPPLLLTFILASLLLSPVQGPLGIANSALVLASMAIVGIAIDFASLTFRKRRAELEPETTRSGQVSAS
ncbi:MAG TPA: hypothetical protein VK804_31010 [Bradyrhizobium sp.]|jgi:hypothetical protein|uniref:hypothetical protein n=1 Tax=Bradyrhizobium sp. TaxID=376 RepID=UPI002C1DB7E7|nr:hypothetical protein [Bradyrhizobium sp.]HTB04924.1 hypothetical protein [Bradyrhizobium sp.]